LLHVKPENLLLGVVSAATLLLPLRGLFVPLVAVFFLVHPRVFPLLAIAIGVPVFDERVFLVAELLIFPVKFRVESSIPSLGLPGGVFGDKKKSDLQQKWNPNLKQRNRYLIFKKI